MLFCEFDVEWDDENILHATGHGVSVTEIEQAIQRADGYRQSRRASDRIEIRSNTEGGRRIVVVAQRRRPDLIRPITAWEDR